MFEDMDIIVTLFNDVIEDLQLSIEEQLTLYEAVTGDSLK